MNKATVLTLITSTFSFSVALGQTAVPHTFEAGQPARAAEVNANFDELEGAIDVNAAAISSNDTDISQLQTGVSANASGISDNSGAISQLQTSVSANAGGVASNGDAISQLQTDVSSNASDISGNSVAISQLQSDISSTADAIAKVASIAIPRVEANGEPIGTFVTAGGGVLSDESWPNKLSVISDAGYMFTVHALPGVSGRIEGEVYEQLFWYETIDCSGTAYVATLRESIGRDLRNLFRSGYVFASPDSTDLSLYYTPKGSNAISLTARAQNSGGSCNPQTENISAVALLPNDPLLTGVPNQRNFSPPVTIGVELVEIPTF